MEGLVYPDFAKCVVPMKDVPKGMLNFERDSHAATNLQRVGGVDFGFRNPFAAVWGVVDFDGVLWLTGEHYQRQRPITFHATKMPRGVTWYADPSGANEICELRNAGHSVIHGRNALTPGIAAVRPAS